jgi:hypothetical protein
VSRALQERRGEDQENYGRSEHHRIFARSLDCPEHALFGHQADGVAGRKKVRLARAVFRTTFRLFRVVIVRIPSEQTRDTLWAFYAPMSVMLLPLTWVILLMLGFTILFWGVSEPSLGTALSLSGAAITTEGFLAPKGGAQITLYIIGGIIGLGIVGLLITFLPTVYSIYSQREQEVTRVAFRFGAPPSGVKVLAQSYRLGLGQELDQFWHTWEEWFTDMAETHLSNGNVIFYRSSPRGLPQQVRSWTHVRSFPPRWTGRMCPGCTSATRPVVVR